METAELPCRRRDWPGYRSWASMIQRCHNERNEAYPRYGGRGLEVYQPSRDDSLNFFNDVGVRPAPGLTLERLDNSKGYFPGNVAWADRKAQAANRRPLDREALSARVKAQMAERWAGHQPAWEREGISRSTYYRRKWRARDAEKAGASC